MKSPHTTPSQYPLCTHCLSSTVSLPKASLPGATTTVPTAAVSDNGDDNIILLTNIADGRGRAMHCSYPEDICRKEDGKRERRRREGEGGERADDERPSCLTLRLQYSSECCLLPLRGTPSLSPFLGATEMRSCEQSITQFLWRGDPSERAGYLVLSAPSSQ